MLNWVNTPTILQNLIRDKILVHAGSGRLKLRQLHHAPNVFEVENFLTESEIGHIGRIVASKHCRHALLLVRRLALERLCAYRSGGFPASKVNKEDDALLGVDDESRTSTSMW